MNQFFKKRLHLFAVPIFTLLITSACDKDMSVMLDNSATGDVGVSFIDSFTVNTSTVQLDNLPSLLTGNILVGKAEVPNIGSLTVSSFFQLGFSDLNNDIPLTAVFDSVNLVLKPTKDRYYFGDTTKVQKISVHQLTEAMETSSLTGGIQNTSIPIYVTGANIFSKKKFDYAATSIGAISFSPKVRSLDSLNIKIADNIGKEIYDLIKNNDTKVSSNANFREYFKGLALVSDNNNTTALAFTDTLKFSINYSYTGTDGFKKKASKVLSIIQSELQHNYIEYDRSGTDFAALSLSKKEIKTSETAGLTFVQAGTGVVAKMTFPSLKEFLLDDKVSINKAELVIETTSTTTNTMYNAPNSLMLFVADADGIPINYITSAYGSGIQQVGFSGGNQIGKNGTYTFNLISYLKFVKSTSFYDDKSLYLSAASPSLFSTFNTAFIAKENAKPKIKLNILYTKFK